MFERFTDEARQAVIQAQRFALEMYHHEILPAHLMLGIAESPNTVGARALRELSRDTEMYDRVRTLITQHEEKCQGQMPFTEDTKKCIPLALHEALSMGYNYIGPEHLLLGITRLYWKESIPALDEHEIDYEMARNVVARILNEDAAKVAHERAGRSKPVEEQQEQQSFLPMNTLAGFIEAVCKDYQNQHTPGNVLVEVTVCDWTVKVPMVEIYGLQERLQHLENQRGAKLAKSMRLI